MEDILREIIHRGSLLGLRILLGLFVFLAFWLGSAFFQKAIRRVYEISEPSKKDALHLLSQTVKIGLLALGVVTALGTMNVDVSALVAGLGLTGFALGFALRDILSNLVAGLLILVYRPFKRHDQISVTGFEGEVTEIDLRYTTLKAEGKRFLIPNATLFTNPISLFETGKGTGGKTSEGKAPEGKISKDFDEILDQPS